MNCPNKPIKSTGIVVVPGVSVTIAFPSETFTAPEIFTIAICQSIPTSAYGLPVLVSFGGVSTFNLLDKCGNFVIGGELRSRQCYRIYFNDFPVHMTVVSPICNICNKTAALVGVLGISETIDSGVATVESKSKSK